MMRQITLRGQVVDRWVLAAENGRQPCDARGVGRFRLDRRPRQDVVFPHPDLAPSGRARRARSQVGALSSTSPGDGGALLASLILSRGAPGGQVACRARRRGQRPLDACGVRMNRRCFLLCRLAASGLSRRLCPSRRTVARGIPRRTARRARLRVMSRRAPGRQVAGRWRRTAQPPSDGRSRERDRRVWRPRPRPAFRDAAKLPRVSGGAFRVARDSGPC